MARRREVADLLKVLELYAGIGGVAATGANVVAAIDHDIYAHSTYTANFDHPAFRINLVSIKPERLRKFDADCWWLSPPCQPFTIRGARKDVDDRRCESLLHLLEMISLVRPARLIVENVPGFEGSTAHARLRHTLRHYALTELEWCPSQLGLPVQRRRFYLLATPDPIETPTLHVEPKPLHLFLDRDPPSHTWLDDDFLDRYGDALHVVDALDPQAVACCFTGAYGHSPVYAGSYLRSDGRLRRFSPAEVARLNGFPKGFRLPELPRRAYKQLGNSLSVDIVRHLLQAVHT